MLIIKKDILVLGEVLTQGLHETPITAEGKYSINFTRPRKKFVSVYIIMKATVFCMSII